MGAAFAAIVLLNVVMADRWGPKPRVSPPRVGVGDRAVLACKGGDGAYVAFDVRAWSRMAHAQARRDAAELGRLVDASEIALIPNGTPLRAVATHTMMFQVRILDGPHAGREGWVRKEFVRAG
jgi:hypothetical protein